MTTTTKIKITLSDAPPCLSTRSNGPRSHRQVATMAGSPSGYKCPHPKHRMQVQVATTPSNEEIGALVFCKCERDEDGGGK